MTVFMRGSLSLKVIYDQLVEDFRRDGKAGVQPDTTFYDNPPTGMGYNPMSLQGFLNTYVNSASGKIRYNLAPQTNILVTDISDPQCVGNLAAEIYAKQQ